MPQANVFTLFKEQDFNFDKQTDVTNCDREPIHVPGLIQPHGILIVFDSSLNVMQLSENVASFLRLSSAPELPVPLASVIGKSAADQIAEKITSSTVIQHNFDLSIQRVQTIYQAGLHRNEQNFVLEIERCAGKVQEVSLSQYAEIIQRLQHTNSTRELCQSAAEAIQALTGFERVMVYQFHKDHSGEVVGEARDPKLDSFLGLHFPASDIPQQARILYQHNPIRIIPDVDYKPVAIVPQINPTANTLLNLSLSRLRSVSPMHIQYLKNMGVKASMSISILLNGELWGLFACHHTNPHHVAYSRREACYLLGRSFSSILRDKLRAKEEVYLSHMREVQTRMFERLSNTVNYTRSLYEQEPTIKELIDCDGCAICFGDDYYSLGDTPAEAQVRQIAAWLQKDVPQDIYHTNSLSRDLPAAADFKEVASGLLAITISRVQQEYIFWFRKEVIQTVTWAGKPDKTANNEIGREQTLTPRESFAAWSEQVRGSSLPWTQLEEQAAREMRGILVDVVMRIAGELKLKAGILSRLNIELERSNSELDSFAYIASHDLKEPLRGIHTYSQFLLEDYRDKLDAAGQEKLQTLVRLSIRMEHLLDSLLHYSQVGRSEMRKTSVHLKQLLEVVKDTLMERLQANNVNLVVADDLPAIECDSVQVQEIFQNLIVNAIKYNKNEQIEVYVGWLEETHGNTLKKVFFVRDNGIGIEERHHEAIFSIFRRLHPRQSFGGGTGVGLTIVKKLVERHGGSIWLRSTPEQGTTFYFTLEE